MRRVSTTAGALLGLMVCLLPSAAEACAVCFGKTDSPLGKGLHWGVFALLAFIFAMLAAFGTFAVYLARRGAAMHREQSAEGTGETNETLGS